MVLLANLTILTSAGRGWMTGILYDHQNNPPQRSVEIPCLVWGKIFVFQKKSPLSAQEKFLGLKDKILGALLGNHPLWRQFLSDMLWENNAKQMWKKMIKKCGIRGGERVSGLGKASLGEMAPFSCSSGCFLLMTVCRQRVSSEDARKNIKGRGRRINMFSCHFQERDGVPTSLPQ